MNIILKTLFIALLASNNLQAKIVLPELLAKQAVNNIRFLSQDGKFTYYQKRSGSLLYSSNYKVVELLKGKVGTQYTLIGSASRKKIVILQNENFHNFYSLRAKQKIFVVNFGETTLKEMGTGNSAALHLNDAWVSFYDNYTRTITFESSANSALKFTIKLNNKINPYFVPQVVMSDEDTIYYTDLSETGAVGLLQYKRTSGKAQIIFKATTPMMKAEICLHENSLIMALIGINYSKDGTVISKATLPLTDFTKRESIYNSPTNDVGGLICDYNKDSNITFIKNYGTNEHYTSDLVDLNPATKATTPLSEMKTISSAMNMDGTILALDKGRYYIVKGTTDYKNIDSLKSLPPAEANAAIKQLDGMNE